MITWLTENFWLVISVLHTGAALACWRRLARILLTEIEDHYANKLGLRTGLGNVDRHQAMIGGLGLAFLWPIILAGIIVGTLIKPYVRWVHNLKTEQEVAKEEALAKRQSDTERKKTITELIRAGHRDDAKMLMTDAEQYTYFIRQAGINISLALDDEEDWTS